MDQYREHLFEGYSRRIVLQSVVVTSLSLKRPIHRRFLEKPVLHVFLKLRLKFRVWNRQPTTDFLNGIAMTNRCCVCSKIFNKHYTI